MHRDTNKDKKEEQISSPFSPLLSNPIHKEQKEKKMSYWVRIKANIFLLNVLNIPNIQSIIFACITYF